jgi:hypothetical protein
MPNRHFLEAPRNVSNLRTWDAPSNSMDSIQRNASNGPGGNRHPTALAGGDPNEACPTSAVDGLSDPRGDGDARVEGAI